MVANCDRLSKVKYSSTLPYAFTEHGAVMAASVLNTPRAVEVSVFIVRAFVRLRQAVAEHQELAAKMEQLERRLAGHDSQILALVRAIRKLASPDSRAQPRRIGFRCGREARSCQAAGTTEEADT